MFGTAAPSNSGSLFGASKPAATSGFGSTGTNSGTGFSFGSNNNNNPQNTNTSGGLFGGSNKAANSTSGGLFGASNNTSAPATGGLFGSSSQAPASSNAGLFGNAAAKPASGGLFGANNNQSQPSTGGLFGSNASQQPAQTGGLFGSNNTQQAASTGGLFGSSTNTSQPNTGGLFGSSNTQGSTNTSNLFGSTQQNQQNQQAQPQLQQQQTSTGFTNNSSQPAFSWSQQNGTTNQSQSQKQQQPLSFLAASQDSRNTDTNTSYSVNIHEQLAKIKNSWDPNSQQTVLKTYFYNAVPKSQADLYVKPSNEGEEWDKALENRPSVDSIPVRAVGFEDLQKRSQAQVNHVAQARVILQQISEKYKVLSDKHDLDTASRIVAAKAKHTIISRRLLRLVSTLSVLKSKGYQLSPSEEKLIQTFQDLLNKSQDPSGLGKSNELWARLSILKEKAKSLSEQFDNSLGINSDEVNRDEGNDAEQTQTQVLKIAKVLQEQHNGIKYLSELIKDDSEIIEKLSK